MTGPGAEKAGQAHSRRDSSRPPRAVAAGRRPGRVTVTFHEPGMPPAVPAARRAPEAWRSTLPGRGGQPKTDLPSRPLSGRTQTWELIVILLSLAVGALAIVFAAAGARAGTGVAGGVALGLAGAAIHKRRKETRDL